MRLYDINETIEQLLSQVDDDGELPESVFEKIAELQIGETEKIESISCFIKDLRAESAEIAEEAKRLQARKKAKESKQERLEAYLSGYLQSTGKSKFETSRVVLSFRKSEAVDVLDEDAVIKFADQHIDMGLIKTKAEVVKTAIKAAIKSGIDVPGAAIIERQSLQVK